MAINMSRNSIPADALISRSFKTGILYPSTFSPNCKALFTFKLFKFRSILYSLPRYTYVSLRNWIRYLTPDSIDDHFWYTNSIDKSINEAL